MYIVDLLQIESQPSVATFRDGQGIIEGHCPQRVSTFIYAGATVTSTNPISGDTVEGNFDDPSPSYPSKQRLNIQEDPGYASGDEEQLDDAEDPDPDE